LITREQITGLVLAGGRGSRMGGVDKGLQRYRGQALALQALTRLRPQVGRVLLSANRNLDAYRGFGVPVWPDAQADFAGPLAGLLAGLDHCETEWLASVACDTPRFPTDLVSRLCVAIGDADIAMAVTEEDGERRAQPVFCLLRTALRDDLRRCLTAGGRKAEAWMAQHGCVEVPFPDAQAFANANTLDELQRLEDRDA
jgi:molybdenum cofactor guanylyltransferase